MRNQYYAGYISGFAANETGQDCPVGVPMDYRAGWYEGAADAGIPVGQAAPRTILVTRHPGARKWVMQRVVPLDAIRDHLDPARVRPGDRIIGTLPIHHVAAITEIGASYWHLQMDVPPTARGDEMTPEQMDACGAHLRQYTASAVRYPGRIK